ncbi:MAG: hypothetical protein HQL73_12125 [Magnetococcales bacterium]|nr:hypothetical protein [Magnetococcales bacterium]
MKSHILRQSRQHKSKKGRMMSRNDSRQGQSLSEAAKLDRKEKLDQEIFDRHLLGYGACG